MFFKQHRLLFIILFLHVSLLDLFFVNKNGPVFLWQDNSQLITLFTHLFSAIASVLFCVLISKLIQSGNTGRLVIADKLLIIGSIALLVAIYFQLS